MRIQADDYLTPEQYRRLCGFANVETVLVAIKAGRLDAVKFGHHYMIPANAVLQTNRNGQSIGKYKKRMERRKQIEQEMYEQGYTPEDFN